MTRAMLAVREATEDDDAFTARRAGWRRASALASLRETLVEELEAAELEPWLDERRPEPTASVAAAAVAASIRPDLGAGDGGWGESW